MAYGYSVTDGDTLEALIAAYEDECAGSRETAAAYDLDQVFPHPWLGEVSLRRISCT